MLGEMDGDTVGVDVVGDEVGVDVGVPAVCPTIPFGHSPTLSPIKRARITTQPLITDGPVFGLYARVEAKLHLCQAGF